MSPDPAEVELVPDSPLRDLYPEVRAGGYTRHDGWIEFFRARTRWSTSRVRYSISGPDEPTGCPNRFRAPT